jgi:dipeptidyl aminopeptidase/acylaminoacyl peptidase
LHSLAQTGELRQEGACDTDIQAATVDNNGDVLTYSPFVTRRSIVGPDYAAAVGDYDSLLPVEVDGSGVAVFWKDDRSGSAFLEVSEKDRAHPRVLAKGRSPKHQGFNAIPVSGKTADNFVAHGFLLSPAANAKLAGLVVVLHGGPYTASDDSLTTPLSDELLDRGYAVLSVNYRGTPGYGRSYLEKGFDGGAARMLDDVDAVQSSALKILGRGRDLPVFLYGRSFGGLLAIKAMRERANVYTGYLIEGGICDFNVSAQNVMLPESATKASLRDVLEPSIGAYNLRIATDANGHALELNDCDVTLPDTARLVVLHSKDDPIAPYASMANFANRQSVDRTTLVTFQNEGHAPLTTLRTGSRDQFNLVAGKVIDFLGGGRLSIIPRPTTDEPQHESR